MHGENQIAADMSSEHPLYASATFYKPFGIAPYLQIPLSETGSLETPSSSGESGTNRAAAAGDIRAPMRGRRKRIAKTVGCSRQTVSDVLVASGFAENSHLTEIGKLLFRATQHQGAA